MSQGCAATEKGTDLDLIRVGSFLRAHPAFARVFLADALSQLGQGMIMVAFPIFVLQVSGDVSLTGLSFAMEAAAFALFSPLAGALADRLEQKRVMQTVNLTRIWLLFWLLRLLAGKSLTPCLAVALALGASGAFFAPARAAFLRRLLDGPELIAAVSLEGTANFLIRLLAPAVVGAVLALFPATAAIWSGVLVYAAAVALLLPSWVTGPFRPSKEPGGPRWTAGWAHLAGTASLRSLLLLDVLLSAISWASWATTVAFLGLVLHLSAQHNGILMATTGLAGALGTRFGTKLRPGKRTYVGILMVLSLSYLSVPQVGGLAALVALWGLRGLALGVLMVLVSRRVASDTPADRIGRVQAAWEMSVRLAGFLGSVATPLMLRALGPQGSFYAFGLATLLGALCWMPRRR